MIDSHCHLADSVFADDLEESITRARTAGVEGALIVLAAGDSDEALRAARVRALWPDVRFAVGVHPHSARDFADTPAQAAEVVRAQLTAMPGGRAVGEIGLDYHYDYSPREVQREVFRAQLRLAIELGHPVVIHTREAEPDTIDLLRAEGGGRLRGVLHCFTGTAGLARAGLELGLYISFAGIITFPRAQDLRDTARLIPLDRLLVETDSPFLAPVPHRGKRNEPAHVSRVVAAVAELRGIDRAVVAESTTANFHALFGS